MSRDLVGQILLDRYRVDTFIESGGSAAVYRVWDLKRNVSLAMKVLHGDLAEDPTILKRFQREANALKKLAHPNIVPFYGMYQARSLIFLLEHFIDGPSLKDVLRNRQNKILPMNETLTYLKALSAALGYAHVNGVVHCDIKPGNVLIDRGGNIYLTDFGIARHSESTTTAFGVAGTPAYMAPEQIRGEKVSAASDVYALGVMVFELLAGRRPFRGTETSTERGGQTLNERIRYGHLHVSPPDPRSFNPAISENIAQIIMLALKKKPEDRFQSVQDFFRELCLAAGVNMADIPERVALGRKSDDHSVPTENIQALGTVSRSLANWKDRSSFFGRRPVFLSALGITGLIVVLSLLGMTTSVFNPFAKVLATSTPTLTSTSPPTLTQTPRPTRTPTKTPRPTFTATPRPTRTPDFASTPWAQYQCQDKGRIILRVQVRGKVVIGDIELLERPADQGSKDHKVVRLLKAREHIRVLNGPQCWNDETWWEVRTESGNTGWIREIDKTRGRLLTR